MGLLDKFRSKSNPTDVWKAGAASVSQIDFDFSTHSLSGIKLGDSSPLLWKLGPPEDKTESRQGGFCYHTKGFRADVENGLITGFTLFWNQAMHRPFEKFHGVCRYRGQVLPLKAGSLEPEIIGFFGEPYWRDEDEDEVILFYEFKNVEWQIEISRCEGMTTFVVITPPLMADAQQRGAYKVTKPWPPPGR
jgi:hypothetical protein